MGYSPLASPKKPWSKPTDPNPLNEAKLQAIAKKHKKTTAQVILRWIVSTVHKLGYSVGKKYSFCQQKIVFVKKVNFASHLVDTG